MSIKKMCTILLISSVMIGIGAVTSFAENIDPDNDDSQYAYGENVGWLNFEPGGNGGSGAEVTDSAVTGYVWGENIGWINMSPVSYGGVTNDGVGNLSGYAWGENVGWINFAPTGGGVTIGSDGVFNGWAWGENIGWIHFRNDAIPYKVKTAWAPLSTTPTPTVVASPTVLPSPTEPPTAIELVSFKAKANSNGGVILTWETASETDNAGFNIYRATCKKGDYTKINDEIIPAEGNATTRASYSYEDTPGRGKFYYKLEDVDTSGVSTMHGPVRVKVTSDEEVKARKR